MTASIKAIVHISAKYSDLCTQLLLSLDVDPIYKITGKYDIMFIVTAANIELLNEMIDEIRNINGVITTSTEIVLKEINND